MVTFKTTKQINKEGYAYYIQKTGVNCLGEVFDRKEEYESNKKNIAGPFKLTCSAVHTALEIRKEGQVRPHGPFPKFPGIGIPADMCARDWNYVITPNKDEWVAGPWKS